jgi:hypothetical protein
MLSEKGTGHLADLELNWAIILKAVLKKYVGRVWTGFNWHKRLAD